jgi:BON domain
MLGTDIAARPSQRVQPNRGCCRAQSKSYVDEQEGEVTMVFGSSLGPAYGLGMGIPSMAPYYPSMAPYLPSAGFPATVASDQSIARMVVNSINTDAGIPSDSDITVDVDGGIVILTGTVPTKFAKHRAGDDAWWLPDVIDVQNQLQIKPRRERARKEERGKQEAH